MWIVTVPTGETGLQRSLGIRYNACINLEKLIELRREKVVCGNVVGQLKNASGRISVNRAVGQNSCQKTLPVSRTVCYPVV
ncbi:hypothetical protein DSECCO2_586320 [anaerobic digester metagenome]